MALSLSPRIRAALAVGSFGVAATYCPTVLADNPIVQTLYTADPAPLVHDGTLYVYTTHDEDELVDGFFTMNEWRVYSSTDAVNFTDHGSPLHYRDFGWATGAAWAGQVIHRDGRFYFYVPVRVGGVHRIGVAVSDSPTGPFVDPLGQPLIASDCGDIDPTVFIDDDGAAYLYWGNPSLCYVRLNDDMISYQGEVEHVPMTTASFGVRSDAERPTSYEEGPWFYRREGRYYLVFAAGPISEHIGYAVSPGPTGPWTYGGVVMPTEGSSFTNHPGIVDYKGSSLFFYHNGALPGGGGFHRSVCVEAFTYGADGGIPRLSMTSEGAAAVDTLNPYARVQGETIAWASGIETEANGEGGVAVSHLENGDLIQVKAVDFGTGAASFEARVASATEGGTIELRLDSAAGPLIGSCSVAGTGDWRAWTNSRCAVSAASGLHDLFLVFTGGGGYLFNLDWWQFAPLDPGPGMGGSGGSGGSLTQSGGDGGSGGVAAATGGTGGAGLASGGTGGVAAATGGSGDLATGGLAITTGGIVASAGDAPFEGSGGLATGGAASGLVAPRASAAEEGDGCACRAASAKSTGSPAAMLAFAFLCVRRRVRARPR